MKVGILQLTAGDDPAANLPVTLDMVRQAATAGADLICTPEVTNCVSQSRKRQNAVLRREADDITLAALCDAARDLGVWIALGSLAVKTDDPDGRFANRSFLIGPDGAIVARYDKIHMFDVAVSEKETFRESAGYRPGESAVLARTPLGVLGLTICYDLRFPALYRALAQAGAEVLLVPSAFLPATGRAHWEPLLRARAIETGAYVIAAAQTGTHPVTGGDDGAQAGMPRETYGHSLVVDPWGKVIADAGTDPGVTLVDLDMGAVAKARIRVPSLTHDRQFAAPQ